MKLITPFTILNQKFNEMDLIRDAMNNRKLATEGAKAKQQNMYREWEGNQTSGNFEISPSSLYTPPSSSKSSSSGNKQKIVSYEDALKNRTGYQDLLNQFHSGGDTSQTAWEALQS